MAERESNTHQIHLSGVLETPESITPERLLHLFTLFVERKGWAFTGIVEPYVEQGPDASLLELDEGN